MPNKVERISSRENSRLVAARKVRDGKDPLRIFVEGRRLVAEALKSNLPIEECFVSDSFGDDLSSELTNRTSVVQLSDKLFASIADTKNPQGIAVILERPVSSLDIIGSQLTSASIRLVIFLKKSNNPSNLGAILRTAEAAGIAGVIVSSGSADAFSAKSIRASMGAVFCFPIIEDMDFNAALQWADENGLIVTASDVTATESYWDIDWRQPRLLIFGSEAHGLDASELEVVADKIFIPMDNDVESLNLAVSAGIILFEAKRQSY